MAATSQVPRMVTLTPAQNTATNLLTALQAVDAGFQSIAQHCEIQLDPDAGAAKLYIGNSEVDTSHWGVKLLAGQAWTPPSMASNLIQLSQIYLYCDTATTKIGVTVVTR